MDPFTMRWMSRCSLGSSARALMAAAENPMRPRAAVHEPAPKLGEALRSHHGSATPNLHMDPARSRTSRRSSVMVVASCGVAEMITT